MKDMGKASLSVFDTRGLMNKVEGFRNILSVRAGRRNTKHVNITMLITNAYWISTLSLLMHN